MSEEKTTASHPHPPELTKRLEQPVHQADQVYFAEEQKGWHGYVEWEKYPDKAKKAAEILSKYSFAGVRARNAYGSGQSLIKIIAFRNPNFN